jgi:uncharacterized membrane protein
MVEIKERPLTVAGVFGAAVIATFLLTPAMDRLSQTDGLGLGAAIMVLPTAAVLTVTGYRYYGLLRSLGVAVVVTTLTSVIAWVVAVFTLAAAVAESPAALAAATVLYATPAACVVICGLLAMRIVSRRSEASDTLEREQAHR